MVYKQAHCCEGEKGEYWSSSMMFGCRESVRENGRKIWGAGDISGLLDEFVAAKLMTF